MCLRYMCYGHGRQLHVVGRLYVCVKDVDLNYAGPGSKPLLEARYKSKRLIQKLKGKKSQ